MVVQHITTHAPSAQDQQPQQCACGIEDQVLPQQAGIVDRMKQWCSKHLHDHQLHHAACCTGWEAVQQCQQRQQTAASVACEDDWPEFAILLLAQQCRGQYQHTGQEKHDQRPVRAWCPVCIGTGCYPSVLGFLPHTSSTTPCNTGHAADGPPETPSTEPEYSFTNVIQCKHMCNVQCDVLHTCPLLTNKKTPQMQSLV